MRRTILLIFLILNAGCDADFKFDRPEVVSVSPSHNSTLVAPDASLIVEFSNPMDKVKTNSEFSLTGGSGAVDGVFRWEDGGRRMIFTPRLNLPVAEKFTIRITEGAEDTDGNDLKEEHVSVFFISGENGKPSVSSYAPAANSTGNLTGTTVVITFSEPVDLNSIYSGISVSPSVQGVFTWNGDSTVITFTPLYGFNSGVTYTVTVDDSILDVSGNRLNEQLVFNFTVGDDFTKPELSVYQDISPALDFDEAFYTHGAEKDKRLVLKFSEVIITDTLRSSISISPSADYYITSETSAGATVAYINFTEYLQSEVVYTLRVNSGITDLQDNPLIKDYRYVFVTDGVNSLSPAVNQIGDLAPPHAWNRNDIELLLISALHPLLYSDVVVDFSSEIDPLSLSIYAESVAGTGGAPSVINIQWPDAPPVKFTRLKFDLYNAAAGNIYRIVIKGGTGGLKDMKGNYMKEDFEQMIRF